MPRHLMRDLLFPPSPLPAPILVVDDDDAIRAALRLVLEDTGYLVVEATTARDTLAQLRTAARGYLVLLDWLLPDNTASLLQTMERETVQSTARSTASGSLQLHGVVLLTAALPSRFTGEEQRLIAATCLGVITKPFDLEQLLGVVERAAAQLPNAG